MAQQFPSQNPYYLEYIRLLKGLHLLEMRGLGDSEEADTIMEQMDTPWYRMTSEEMALAKIMSADLRMIEGKEVFRPVPPEQRTREWLGPKLYEASQRQDWVSVLTLLRNGPDYFSPEQLAILRGEHYTDIGHPDIGLLFFEHIARCNPQEGRYSVLILRQLLRLGDIREAEIRANAIIEKQEAHPLELFMAATVLCLSTESMSDEDRKPILEKVISALTTALQGESKLSPGEQSPEFKKRIHLRLGQVYAWLEQTEAARVAYDYVLDIDPENADALTLRGLLLLNSDEVAAGKDFEQAVKHNAMTVIPYLDLAHKALEQGTYQKCLDLCRRALTLTQQPSTQARILSWIAIANIYLGSEDRTIRGLFEQAMALDPLNEEIRQNYELFRQERDNSMRSSDLKQQTALSLGFRQQVGLRQQAEREILNRNSWTAV